MDNYWETAFEDIIDNGTASNSQRAHDRDLKYFLAWCNLTNPHSLVYPVSEDIIIQFIVDHAGYMALDVEQTLIDQGLKRKSGALSHRTIRRFIGSISFAHDRRGVANPCQSKQIRLLLKKLTIATTSTSKVKKAITQTIFDAMLMTCDDDLVGLRDRALLQVAMTTGGRRRSEIASIEIESLEPTNDGYFLHIGRSKNDQEGVGNILPLFGAAASDVKAWILRSGIRHGQLFRGIHRSGCLRAGISPTTINRIVKRRVQLAGFDPTEFSAHSLRSGFITEASCQKINIQDIIQLTLHKDIKVCQGYYRKAELLDNPASYLMSPPKKGKIE